MYHCRPTVDKSFAEYINQIVVESVQSEQNRKVRQIDD